MEAAPDGLHGDRHESRVDNRRGGIPDEQQKQRDRQDGGHREPAPEIGGMAGSRLVALGLHDAFRLFEQPPKSWSWWDYRNLAFRKNQGLRIDHILVSDALRARVQACAIDKAPRRNEKFDRQWSSA